MRTGLTPVSFVALAITFLVVVFAGMSDRVATVVTLGEQGATGQRGDVRLVEGANVTITQDNSASTITLAAASGTPGLILAVAGAAQANPATKVIRLYTREDINVTGGAANDCVLRARLQDGTEVTVVILVADAGCP